MDCPVCMLTTHVITLICGHQICSNCLDIIIKRKYGGECLCPLCRCDFTNGPNIYNQLQNNNVNILQYIGFLYETGCQEIGLAQNLEKAIESYTKAIDAGVIPALWSLTELYYFRYHDSVKAIEYMKKAIEKNYYGNCSMIGHIYLNKLYKPFINTNDAYEKAFFSLERGITNVEVLSFYNMGYLYEKGLGKEKNAITAYDYYLQGYNNDRKYCGYKLGQYTEEGIVVEKNIDMAMTYYERSIGDNLIESNYKSLFRYAMILINRKEDVFRSGELLTQCIINYTESKEFDFDPDGYFDPYIEIVKLHLFSGIPLNIKKKDNSYYTVEELLNISKDTFNNKQAYYYLAFLMETKPKNKIDYQTLFDYYSLAAFNGNASAQCKLGDYYINGVKDVISQDVNVAIRWYKLASRLGDILAIKKLAQMYDDGIYIEKNLELANKYFKQVIDEYEKNRGFDSIKPIKYKKPKKVKKIKEKRNRHAPLF